MNRPVSKDQQRASYEERDAALAHLNKAFEEGRLTLPEHESRTSEALAARTRARLRELLADLPGAADPEQRHTRPATKGSAVRPVVIWAVFAIVTFGVWGIPALIMGTPTVVAGWAAFCGFWGIPALAVSLSRRRGGH